MTMAARERLLWKSWGKGVADARRRHGLTQVALAEQMQVTQSTISKWENGDLAPDDATKMRLCEFFNRSLDDLFGWPIFIPPEHSVR